MASRDCIDVRCQRTWKPTGSPTSEEQLARWVEGDSVCPNDRHECCPDFSCCKPELQWSAEKRQKFASATQGEREKMLMGALGELAKAAGKKVHVTRGEPADHE